MVFSVRSLVFLCLFFGVVSGHSNANEEGTYYQNTKVIWRGDAHQPFYSDINGDGINDLFLQGRSRFHFSYWVVGELSNNGTVAYHNYNSRLIYAPLHDASLTLGDVNGDGLSDVITPNGIMFASEFGFEPLDDNNLSSAENSDLPQNAYIFKSGDFNGDGMDDLLALSKNGDEHLLYHAQMNEIEIEDEENPENEPQIIQVYTLEFAQQIKDNRWGHKERGKKTDTYENENGNSNHYQEHLAERIRIIDVDGDGKHDIFARSVKANKDHYVAYADQNGLFTNNNSKKLKAKLTGVDWHAQGYSAVLLPQPTFTPSLTGSTTPAELMRMNNAEGGINEHGEITPIYIDPVNHVINLHTEEVLVGSSPNTSDKSTSDKSTSDKSKTEPVLKSSSAPATPTTYPDVVGGSYQPYAQTHTVTFNSVSLATHYELYQSFNDTNSYQKIYQGSDLSYSGAIGYTWGYYYYAYKACSYITNSCSGLGPARRIYIYTNPSLTGSISFSPNGVNTNENYNVNFAPAGGAVDGTTYTLKENSVVVWSHIRQSWDESVSYQLPNVSKQCPGDQVYTFRACNPGNLCSNTLVATQTIFGTGTETTPDITSTAITEGTVGTNYSYQLSVNRHGCTNNSTATTYSLLQAPSGMSINSNGLITWLPSTQGQYTVNVRATIGSAHDYQQYTINVAPNTNTHSIAWADVKSLNQQSFTIKWGLTGDIQPDPSQVFKVEQQYNNGSWSHVNYVTGGTQTHFTNKSAGRYRYRVWNCGTDNNCSQIVQTVPFTVGSLSASSNINSSVSLSGLYTNVGATSGAFKVSESGAATYNVPITLPAGVAGVAPQVSLNYSSQGGIGLLGKGWSINAGQSISRCSPSIAHHGTIDGLNYNDSDKFCYNGQLLEESNVAGVYYTKLDSQIKITAHGSASGSADSGPAYFTLENKAGETWYFGDSADSFVEPSFAADNSVAKWYALNKIADIAGNSIEYHYNEDKTNGSHYISQIQYGGNSNQSTSHFVTVDFNYQDTPHPQGGYSYGSAIDASVLLKDIAIEVGGQTFRTYQLTYLDSGEVTNQTYAPETGAYLESITECTDANNCLAPLTFNWHKPNIGQYSEYTSQYCQQPTEPTAPLECVNYTQTILNDFAPFEAAVDANSDSAGWYASQTAHFYGDGKSDIVYKEIDINGDITWKLRLGESLNNTHTIATDDYDYGFPFDVDGDGVQEFLFANKDEPNDGITPHWVVTHGDPLNPQKNQLTVPAINPEKTLSGDINGDGLLDIVFIQNSQIKYYRNTTSTGLPSFANAQTLINLSGFSSFHDVSYAVAKTGLMDINGDGRSDMIAKITEHRGQCQGGAYADSESECSSVGGTWIDESINLYHSLIATGSINSPSYTASQNLSGASGSNDEIDSIMAADVNGDGLSDIVYKDKINTGEYYWHYRVSDGNQFLAPSASETRAPAPTSNGDDQKPLMIDLNQDGRTDMLAPIFEGANAKWRILISRAISNSDIVVWEQRGLMDRPDGIAFMLGDINGDGRADLLSAGDDNGWQVAYGREQGEVIEVIDEFITGQAGNTISTHIDYAFTSDWDMKAKDQNGNIITTQAQNDSFLMTTPVAVVEQVRSDINKTSIGVKQQVSVNYRYGELQMHRKGYGNLGFKVLQTIDNQSGVITSSYYHQDYPYIGMPERTLQYSAATGGKILSESENDYITQAAHHGGTMVVADLSTQTEHHLGNDSASTHVETTTTVSDHTYDAWGNLTEQIVTIKDAGESELSKTISTNIYGNSSDEKFHGRLSQSTVTKSLNADSSTAITRTSNFTYYAKDENCQIAAPSGGVSAGSQIKGMLKSSTVNGKDTRQCYNAFGQSVSNQTSAMLNLGDTQATSFTTHQQYSNNGRALISSWDTAGHQTKLYYNNQSHGVISGPITSIKTETPNGLWKTSHFNLWGETIATQSPLAPTSYSVKHYCNNNPKSTCPTGAVFAIEAQQDGSPSASQYFDAWGREIGTRTDHFENLKDTYTRKAYDNQGRLEYSYQASTSSTPSNYYQKVSYDNFGRVTNTTLPNGGTSQEIYTSDNTTGSLLLLSQTTDPLGNITEQYRNLLGQLVKVVDATGGELHYTYNAFGDLLTVNQKANSTSPSTLRISHQYNTYGQKTQTFDSQIGAWHYQYNGFGQVVQQTDANNAITTKVYDYLGRLAQQYSYDSNQCWSYSNTAPTIGKVTKIQFSDYLPSNKACASSADVIHSIDNYFDSLGRPTGQKETIANASEILNDSYYQYQSYDQYGRPKYSKSAGTGTVIRQDYNTHGRTYRWVNDRTGRSYQKFNSANNQGQINLIQYANGTKEYLTYSSDTGQILHQTLTGTYASHYAGYLYDINQQLSSQERNYGATSQNARTSETFYYDNLYRLTEKSVSVAIAGTLPNDLKMTQTFNYDGFGQLQSQTGIGNYQYNSKNQLTNISGYTKSNQAQFTGATYDYNGNLLGDGVRDFHYTSYNKAQTINKGSDSVQFIYGINHKRFARLQSVNGETTSTAYIAGGVEKVVKGSHIQYRTTVQNTILTDSNGDNEHAEAYLHKDRQGSPITITNQDGRVVQQFGYGPFGKVYQLQSDSNLFIGGVAPTSRHYTGHESVDDFGLIHMNGRMYDPNIGRFIQADPFVQEVNNTQNYNRYSYVLNNPMNYTDPSGYLFFSAFKSLLRDIASVPIINTIITIGLNFIPQCTGGWCSAVYAGASTYAVTGSLGQGVKTGLVSYAAAKAHGTIGDNFKVGSPRNVFFNALVGGISAELQGGKFGHAFTAAGFSAALKPLINDIGGENSANAAIAEGNLAKLEIHKVDRIIAAAIIGGTASVISGGKFANGALSGALTQMYNNEQTLDTEIRWRMLVNEFKISILDAYMMGKEGDIKGYINKVKSYGDWDFKHDEEYSDLHGIEDFGNFAFGATSQAWADGYTDGYSATIENYELSTNLAMRGAGFYQEYFQTYDENDGSWYNLNYKNGSTNYGDGFQDGANIWQGAMYYYRRKGVIK